MKDKNIVEFSEKGYRIFYKFKPFLKWLFRVEVEGEENVPKEGGILIVSNHRSNLDPLILNAFVTDRPMFFLAKKELFKIPILGKIITKAGAIPVDRKNRDSSSLKKSLWALKNGHVVTIFPEGTRMKQGQFGKPQKGAGLLALKGKVPVVPVLIEGTDVIFPKGAKFPRLFKSKIKLKIGKPFVLDGIKDYEEASNLIMEKIKELSEVKNDG